MCIVSHGYGGLGGVRDGGGGWVAFGTKSEVGHMSGDARTLPEFEEIH